MAGLKNQCWWQFLNFFLNSHRSCLDFRRGHLSVGMGARCSIRAPYFPLAPGGHSTGGAWRGGTPYPSAVKAFRPASVIRTLATATSLPPALTFSCAIVASPRLTSPTIVAARKPCAASNGPVTPLRPAPASKPSARRCSAVKRVRRRLRRRDGARRRRRCLPRPSPCPKSRAQSLWRGARPARTATWRDHAPDNAARARRMARARRSSALRGVMIP
jgi:hypothetical protein